MEKIKRTKVVDLLKSTAYGSIVNVKGWVRTHRSSKAVDFIALNDGSTINNIQIVVDPSKVDENQLKQITTGADCMRAEAVFYPPFVGADMLTMEEIVKDLQY